MTSNEGEKRGISAASMVKQGNDLLQQAVALDTAKATAADLSTAVELYLKAAETFMGVLKENRQRAVRSQPSQREKKGEEGEGEEEGQSVKQKLDNIITRIETIQKQQQRTTTTTTPLSLSPPLDAAAVAAVANDLKNQTYQQFHQTDVSVQWSTVAGMESVKNTLKEVVVDPYRFPELFTDVSPHRGVLLFGPPGCGKTLFGKALGSDIDGDFFHVNCSDLVSRYSGDGNRVLSSLFDVACERAEYNNSCQKSSGERKQRQPTVIFFDDFDSAFSERRAEWYRENALKITFLERMNSLTRGVVVVAATSVPWEINLAVIKRFSKKIFCSLPDFNTRISMVQRDVEKFNEQCQPKYCLEEHELADIATRTEGYSGSDLSCVVRDAAMDCVRDIQNATHFKYIEIMIDEGEGKGENGPCLSEEEEVLCAVSGQNGKRGMKTRIVVCNEMDEGAIRMGFMDIKEPGLLLLSPVAHCKVVKIIEKVKASVTARDMKRYEEFAASYGCL